MQYIIYVRMTGGAYYHKAYRIERLFAVPGSDTLADLCRYILNSLDFEFDHLYEFRIHGQVFQGAPFMAESEPEVGKKLNSLGLIPGDEFHLLYDYGASWRFSLKVQEVRDVQGPADLLMKEGDILQYPDEDSWDDVDWEEDEWSDSDDEWETDGEEDWGDEVPDEDDELPEEGDTIPCGNQTFGTAAEYSEGDELEFGELGVEFRFVEESYMDTVEQILEMAEKVLSLPKQEVKRLPPEIRANLEDILEMGVLPRDMARALKQKLDIE